MDERRNISTTRHSSNEIVRANFGTVRKGYDPNEVRTYLEGVAREMHLFETRVQELQQQLAEAQRRAANPVLDEATLAGALGSQSAAILRSAHEEAGRVTAEAQERATAIYAQAQERAATYLVESQERAAAIVSEAEATATHLDGEARAAAQRLVESAKVNGEALVERAREQGRAIVAQAQEARKAVLNDLAVKRKSMHLQIEQMRAARDSLHTSITSVRESVEGVLSGLMSSDEGARAAAIEALRNRPPEAEPSEDEILAVVPLREVPDVAPVVLETPDLSTVSAPTASENPAPAPKSESTVKGGAAAADNEPIGEGEPAADVVEEIFARLRKATLEERGAAAPAPKRAPVVSNAPSTPAEELFARRDAALDTSLALLTRKVKRALQDDQNVMLEKLRNVSGVITNEMEDEFAQRRRYAEAAGDVLRDVALAGAQFAGEETGTATTVTDFTAVDEAAADLAVTIVLALRKRIQADGNGSGDDRANAAYKEWRCARVERLCTDVARRAFHAGVVGAMAGGHVRFLCAPGDAPCDACALDASTGLHAVGTPFPSGQLYPPLHAGCACAVVPA